MFGSLVPGMSPMPTPQMPNNGLGQFMRPGVAQGAMAGVPGAAGQTPQLQGGLMGMLAKMLAARAQPQATGMPMSIDPSANPGTPMPSPVPAPTDPTALTGLW